MKSNQDLFIMLSYQAAINKVLKNKQTANNTQRIFNEFVKLIKRSRYSTEIKVSKIVCEFCGKIPVELPILLPCGHYFCSNACLAELAMYQLDGRFNLYHQVKCLCGRSVPGKITGNALRDLSEFSVQLKESQEKAEPLVSCEICYAQKKMRDFRTLTCEHRFCEGCIKQHVQECIKLGQVNENLSCPQCSKPIEYPIVIDLLDPQIKENFERFLMMKVECKENERFFACPAPNCGHAEIIPSVLKVFNCSQCSNNFCVSCKDSEHPNLTCEHNAELKKMNDPYIKEKFEKGEMRLCPWCLNAVEKTPNSCKYITCGSNECNRKRWFCFDCQKKLSKFHEAHECVTPEVETRNCEVF